MSKTLETKRKILNLLKKRDMTVTELSKELNLSTATISQHMEELVQAGTIDKVENEHFRKLKYYRMRKEVSPMATGYLKYVIGVIAVIALGFGAYLYSANNHVVGSNSYSTAPSTTVNSSALTDTVPQISGGGALACPMFFYQLNGSITSYSGFKAYELYSSNGNVTDYVIGSNSFGSMNATEYMHDVLSEPSSFNATRQHYARLTSVNSTFATPAQGISVTISPLTFTPSNNETLPLAITIDVNSTAPNGTYWLRIDGPCGGGVTPVLLTVGDKPYNGSITQQAYAYP